MLEQVNALMCRRARPFKTPQSMHDFVLQSNLHADNKPDVKDILASSWHPIVSEPNLSRTCKQEDCVSCECFNKIDTMLSDEMMCAAKTSANQVHSCLTDDAKPILTIKEECSKQQEDENSDYERPFFLDKELRGEDDVSQVVEDLIQQHLMQVQQNELLKTESEQI